MSTVQARRMALAASGFCDRKPTGTIGQHHLRRVFDRIGLIQMDSVNVLERAHYLPTYSRLGPYRRTLLDEAAYQEPKHLFEYWGHEASLLPLALHPLLRWRMEAGHVWNTAARLLRERPTFVSEVLDRIRLDGPLAASEIEDAPRGPGRWWNRSDAKVALEYLFAGGKVAASSRNGSWARVYDLPERVLPAAILNTPTPSRSAAQRELVLIAARSLGIATERELRDYFRLSLPDTRTAIAELIESGHLTPTTVTGWNRLAYVHAEARSPRRVEASTLLSPFDPLVWERERTERLFGFRYRIEIYVPAPQRVYGYYVLPFLLGDRLVARVDLKADRAAGVLRVPAAWIEPTPEGREGRGHPDKGTVAAALATQLWTLAGWLGLEGVDTPGAGDLAIELASAM